MSCSFCLRAPQPNSVVRQPSVHPLRALPTAHTLLAPPYGSVAASRPVASPSVSFNPSPPRERKPRTKREESAYGGASGGTRERERAIGPSRERARDKKRKEERREKDGENVVPRLGEGRRKGGKRRELSVSRAPRATHYILLSRLPTLTAGSVPDRRGRMPTTRAGREESHARHPAC